MARIRRWKETLVLACVTLFLSLARAWPLRAAEAASQQQSGHLLLVTGTTHHMAVGVELMAQWPYIRLARVSLLPVGVPLAAGAYTGHAAALGGAPGSPALAMAGSTCPACVTSTAPCCSVTDATCCKEDCTPECYTYECVCETSGTITGYYETCTTGYRSWTCYHECG